MTKAFDRLLVRKDLSALDAYWGPEYHQHNPNIPDGVAGAEAGLGGCFQQFPDLTVSRTSASSPRATSSPSTATT